MPLNNQILYLSPTSRALTSTAGSTSSSPYNLQYHAFDLRNMMSDIMRFHRSAVGGDYDNTEILNEDNFYLSLSSTGVLGSRVSSFSSIADELNILLSDRLVAFLQTDYATNEERLAAGYEVEDEILRLLIAWQNFRKSPYGTLFARLDRYSGTNIYKEIWPPSNFGDGSTQNIVERADPTDGLWYEGPLFTNRIDPSIVNTEPQVRVTFTQVKEFIQGVEPQGGLELYDKRYLFKLPNTVYGRVSYYRSSSVVEDDPVTPLEPQDQSLSTIASFGDLITEADGSKTLITANNTITNYTPITDLSSAASDELYPKRSPRYSITVDGNTIDVYAGGSWSNYPPTIADVDADEYAYRAAKKTTLEETIYSESVQNGGDETLGLDYYELQAKQGLPYDDILHSVSLTIATSSNYYYYPGAEVNDWVLTTVCNKFTRNGPTRLPIYTVLKKAIEADGTIVGPEGTYDVKTFEDTRSTSDLNPNDSRPEWRSLYPNVEKSVTIGRSALNGEYLDYKPDHVSLVIHDSSHPLKWGLNLGEEYKLSFVGGQWNQDKTTFRFSIPNSGYEMIQILHHGGFTWEVTMPSNITDGSPIKAGSQPVFFHGAPPSQTSDNYKIRLRRAVRSVEIVDESGDPIWIHKRENELTDPADPTAEFDNSGSIIEITLDGSNIDTIKSDVAEDKHTNAYTNDGFFDIGGRISGGILDDPYVQDNDLADSEGFITYRCSALEISQWTGLSVADVKAQYHDDPGDEAAVWTFEVHNDSGVILGNGSYEFNETTLSFWPGDKINSNDEVWAENHLLVNPQELSWIRFSLTPKLSSGRVAYPSTYENNYRTSVGYETTSSGGSGGSGGGGGQASGVGPLLKDEIKYRYDNTHTFEESDAQNFGVMKENTAAFIDGDAWASKSLDSFIKSKYTISATTTASTPAGEPSSPNEVFQGYLDNNYRRIYDLEFTGRENNELISRLSNGLNFTVKKGDVAMWNSNDKYFSNVWSGNMDSFLDNGMSVKFGDYGNATIAITDFVNPQSGGESPNIPDLNLNFNDATIYGVTRVTVRPESQGTYTRWVAELTYGSLSTEDGFLHSIPIGPVEPNLGYEAAPIKMRASTHMFNYSSAGYTYLEDNVTFDYTTGQGSGTTNLQADNTQINGRSTGIADWNLTNTCGAGSAQCFPDFCFYYDIPNTDLFMFGRLDFGGESIGLASEDQVPAGLKSKADSTTRNYSGITHEADGTFSYEYTHPGQWFIEPVLEPKTVIDSSLSWNPQTRNWDRVNTPEEYL